MVLASVGAGAARDERAWRHSFGHALGLGQAVDRGHADADRNRLCEECEVDLCEVAIVMFALFVRVAMAVNVVAVRSIVSMVQPRHAARRRTVHLRGLISGFMRGVANDRHGCGRDSTRRDDGGHLSLA